MALMVVFCLILIVLYLFVFAILVFNIIQYLIRQGRFKTFHIGFFYSISLCITIFRIAYFSSIIAYLMKWKDEKDLCPYFYLNTVDDYGVYLELILGI